MPCRDEYADQEAREEFKRECAKQRAMLCFAMRLIGNPSPSKEVTDPVKLVNHAFLSLRESPLILALETRCGVSAKDLHEWFIIHLREDAEREAREKAEKAEAKRARLSKRLDVELEQLSDDELKDLIAKVRKPKVKKAK